jgi:hypothetical protein
MFLSSTGKVYLFVFFPVNNNLRRNREGKKIESKTKNNNNNKKRTKTGE